MILLDAGHAVVLRMALIKHCIAFGMMAFFPRIVATLV